MDGGVYNNPLLAELREFATSTLTVPKLDHELDHGETDEDDIHIIKDDKLAVISRFDFRFDFR